MPYVFYMKTNTTQAQPLATINVQFFLCCYPDMTLTSPEFLKLKYEEVIVQNITHILTKTEN